MSDTFAYAMLLRSLPEPHLLMDTKCVILQVNDSLARLFASRRKDVQGTDLGAWLNEADEVSHAVDSWMSSGQLHDWVKPFTLLHAPDTKLIASGGLLFQESGEHLILVRLIERGKSHEMFAALDRQLEELRQQNHMLADLQTELERQVHERTLLLRLSEEETRAIVDSAADAIMTMDDEFNVLGCNFASEKVLGVSSDRIIGSHIEALLPDVLEGLYISDVWLVGEESRAPRIISIERGDDAIPLEVVISRYEVENQRRYTCIARDVSERARAAQVLREQKEELEQVNRELRSFTAVASHDLKAPLRKITILSELLEEDFYELLPEEGRLHLTRMRDASKKMRTLIDDLLELSRVSMSETDMRPVSLSQVISDVVSLMDIQLESTGGSIVVGDFEEVIADERQLRQLFQNLIANAIKFQSAERPLRVDVFQAPEPAHSMLDRPHLQLIVSDNGIGFDQDRAARIFEPFQRLHTEQEIKGSGIGLAICRRVVERHGGRIWAEGEPGKGASFHILLPLAPSEHAQNSRSRDSSTL